jgi:2,3-bisphosphoglycerate-dependent phosphoglycerate mutase
MHRVPAQLWFVRHGESLANVVRNDALGRDVHEIELTHRDVDVPLSGRGERQASALGRWFADQPADERPTVVIASPYVRAVRTAERIAERLRAAGGAPEIQLDERVREKELGLFYRLTRAGIEARHPDQWALRVQLGRFWFRPPGGESWADVALRLRGAMHDICRDHAGERVLVVCHQVVVLCARYVIERMTERDIVQVARVHDVANCSVTSYRGGPQGLALDRFNFTVPLEIEGATVTAEPNVSARVRQES